MKKYIIILFLINTFITKSFSQSFQGKITYKLIREWISPQDSTNFYKLRTRIPFWKDIEREELFIGLDVMKKNYLTYDSLVYMSQLYKDNEESFFMPMYSSQEVNTRLPLRKLKYIKKEKEKENILGFECQRHKFESVIAGEKKIVYYWITNKFLPTEAQEKHFIDIFQPFGLILKREFVDTAYEKFMWVATKIEQQEINKEILSIKE